MPTADTVLRRAHEGAYRFPAGFAGFTASVRTGPATARLTVHSRDSIELVATDGHPDDAGDLAWARPELASMITHRWPTGYADGDGRWAKSVKGDLVSLLDDPFTSTYRVAGDTIREVHRTVGDVRFVISVAARAVAHDGRYLPSHFAVFHWSTADGRLLRADQYQDSFCQVGQVHLPAARRITTATDDGLSVREFELTDHVLLAGSADA